MDDKYKVPGVYIQEVSALPPQITGVPTDVPAFIGYTEFADGGAYRRAVPIASAADYAAKFGGAAPKDTAFNLAGQIALFYANGGGPCLVFSAGSYWTGQAPKAAPEPGADWALAAPDADALLAALAAAGGITGVTMLVVPEACLLATADHARLIQAMVEQAGSLQDRMAILDLPGCTVARDFAALQRGRADLAAALGPVAQFRGYAAAYAPALKLVDSSVTPPAETLVPPSGAIAGIWVQSDAARSVWDAPANLAVTGVDGLACAMDDDEQAQFNTPVDGVAVDIIRDFIGRGFLVWGARTTDGNSQDDRYVPVRRTLIYIEQSVKLALQPYVFQPNDASTWASVRGMIESFLTGLWREGGLQGMKPSDAFFVRCGMGSTMTGEDVRNGLLIVQIGVAITRPAEFIVLSIVQTMQSSG